MKAKVFKIKALLLMLALFVTAQGAWADEKVINITDLSDIASATDHKVTTGDWTVQVLGDCSYAGSTLTVNKHSQLIISATEHRFSKVVFSNITGTFNKCHNFVPSNDYTTWTPESEVFNNENNMSITPKDGNATFSGTITITCEAAEAGTLKVTPTVDLSAYEVSVIPGSTYNTPGVYIKGTGGADLSNQYMVNYFIDGEDPTTQTYDKDGKAITTDATTGTSITRYYGGLTIGQKAGTVTINIAALPKDDKKYNMVNAKFSFTIRDVDPVVTFSPKKYTEAEPLKISLGYDDSADYTKFNSQTLSLPSYTLTNREGGNLSQFYDCNISIKAGGEAALMIDKTNMTVKSAKDGQNHGTESDNAYGKTTIVYTFTPKSGYDTDTYKQHTEEIVVEVVDAHSSKISSKLTFDGVSTFNDKEGNAKTYHVVKYHQSEDAPYVYSQPKPIITDANGNDISKDVTVRYYILRDEPDEDRCFDFEINNQPGENVTAADNYYEKGWENYDPIGSLKYYKTYGELGDFNPWSNPATYQTGTGTNFYNNNATFQVWHPGKLTVRALAIVGEYSGKDGYYTTTPININGESVYALTDEAGNLIYDDYTLIVEKRSPKVVLNGDPEYRVEVKNGETWTPRNRLEVSGTYTDPYLGDTELMIYGGQWAGKAYDTFWYTFEFPKHDAENYPNESYCELSNYINERYFEYTGEDGRTWCRYYSAEGFGNNDFILTFHKGSGDDGNIKFKYVIHPWNHAKWDIGESNHNVVYFHVDDKDTPKLITPEQEVVTVCSSSQTYTPTVKIVNAAGENISTYKYKEYDWSDPVDKPNFTWEYSIVDNDPDYPNAVNATIDDPTTGVITFSTIDHNSGIYADAIKVKVVANPVEANTTYNGVTSYFTLTIIPCPTNDKPYEIINDPTNDDDATKATEGNQEGKLHFIGKGTIFGGHVIQGIPGLDITIGKANPKSNGWTVAQKTDITGRTTNDLIGQNDGTFVMSNESQYREGTTTLHYVSGNPVQLDSDGIPVSGTFYELRPWTNGYLTVDAIWEAVNTGDDSYKGVYTLIGRNANGKIEKETINVTSATPSYDEKQLRFGLLAGNTYYLYTETGDAALKLHGLAFEPSFLFTRTDERGSINSATAFYAGAGETSYTESVPTLISEPQERVTFGKDRSMNETVKTIADVGEHTGVVEIKGVSTADSDEGRVWIDGKVVPTMNGDNTNQGKIVKDPYFKLFVCAIPTYVTADGYKPSVAENVSTTNYKTNIKMTFGGWRDGVGPYQKKSTQTNTYTDILGNEVEEKVDVYTDLVDSWKVAKMDSVGRNNRTIDGFKYGSQGGQNPYDETSASYAKDYKDANTFDVPCRGTYVRFEPRESGTLILYIMQSGICDYSLLSPTEWKPKLAYRPIYIVDETGQPVELSEASAQGRDYRGSYTECKLRSPLYTVDKTCQQEGDAKGQYFNNNEVEKNFPDFWNTIKAWWGKSTTISEGESGEPSTVEIFQNPADKGYVIVTKAYTRYTFPVKAGKSYFVFAKATKFFFDGYAFLPEDHKGTWAANRLDGKSEAQIAEYLSSTSATITLDPEQASAIYPISPAATPAKANAPRKAAVADANEKNNVEVNLGRKFYHNKWTSICLPFSMSESLFKETFGEDARIITFDNFNNETGDAYFTQHVYHMIEAGRPYFIKPAATAQEIADADDNKDGHKWTKDSDGDYWIQPVIKNVTIEVDKPVITYIDSSSEGLGNGFYQLVGSFTKQEGVMQAGDYDLVGDKLWELTAPRTLGAYRAYIKKVDPSAKPISGFGYTDLDQYVIEEEEDNIIDGIELLYDNTITQKEVKNSNKNVYNIQGQLVRNGSSVEGLSKGIYIVNGKKMIVK